MLTPKTDFVIFPAVISERMADEKRANRFEAPNRYLVVTVAPSSGVLSFFPQPLIPALSISDFFLKKRYKKT
jgi:hypothetical protein